MTKTKKRKQKMHQHSLTAYGQLRNSQQTKLKWAKILGLLINSPPLTDREIALALGYVIKDADGNVIYIKVNEVQPRISDLVRETILEECEEVKCPETGKPVRKVRIKINQESFL